MEEIRTKDIFRSAYLLCVGGHLRTTKLVNGKSVIFFIEGDGLTLEDQQYRTGQATVNPLQLREALNLLRDVIFERKASKERNSNDSNTQRTNRANQAKCGLVSSCRIEGRFHEETGTRLGRTLSVS